MSKIKAWLYKNVFGILYLWTGFLAALVYLVSGEVGYLIAALIVPITQYYSDKVA